MYLKVLFMFKPSALLKLIVLIIVSGCTASQTSTSGNDRNASNRSLENAFSILQQKPPPQYIQSIQLYKKGNVRNAPIITLNSSEKLSLEFDYLGGESKQFKIEATHRNKSWEKSPLPPNFYMGGFNETYFSGGLASFSQRPSYYHFKYEFPNPQLSFKASGNYLLSIYDYDTDELLFTLPFFISEDQGLLNTRIESIFVKRKDLRAEDQPFSTYRYPGFVEFPRFDLTFIYVQNQFWGRSRIVEDFDTSSPEEVNFHLDRDRAFLSNYEFNTLDLRGLNIDGQRILDVQKSTTPPKVILRRDVQAFNLAPRFAPDVRFGIPAGDRSASYANVQFTLETASALSANEKIYLVGDFNNWTISELNRMQYNSETGLWEGLAFIKEGEYAYKYVVLKNRRVDDLTLDQGFRFDSQSYITLVYFKDPTRNFDRLLKVINTVGN